MPFESERQRKYLYIRKPKVARQLAQHGKFTGEEGSWSGWDAGGTTTQQGRVGTASEGTAESAWTDDPGHHTESEAESHRELDVIDEHAAMRAKIGGDRGIGVETGGGSLAGFNRKLRMAKMRVAQGDSAVPVGTSQPGTGMAPQLASLMEPELKRLYLGRQSADADTDEKKPSGLTSDDIGNKAPFTNEQFLAAMRYERGTSDANDLSIAKRVKQHLEERSTYYEELATMVHPDHANLVGKMKHDVSFGEMSELLIGDDDGAEESGYDTHPAAHARVDDLWRDDPVRFNGRVLIVPKDLTTPEHAVFADDIRSERPLHCGNCAAYSGGKKLTGKCSRIQSPGHEPGKLLKVHFFNTCTIHRHNEAGAPLEGKLGALDSRRPMAKSGGWEAGPRGGIRKRSGKGWIYMTEHHPEHSKTKASLHGGPGGAPDEGGSEPEGDMFDQAIQSAIENGKSDEEMAQHLDSVPTEQLVDSGISIINEVRKRDPEAAVRMAAALGGIKRGGGDVKGSVSNAKAFLREFQQSAAPGSVLGSEFGGLLRDGKAETDAQKEGEKAAREGEKAGKVKKAGGTNIAPIGGSAPREETPPIPDYEEIYYQPKDSEHVLREEEQNANRRRANAQRNTAVYGFHGAAGTNLSLEPELRYETDPNRMLQESVMGKKPMLAQRKPTILAPEIKDRLDAGSAYDSEGLVPGKTDHGRAHRSPDHHEDRTVPDIGGRPVPVDDGLDVDDDDDDDDEEVAESHIATYAERRGEVEEEEDEDEDEDRLSEVQD